MTKEKNNTKKPFFKKWWFWSLIVLLIIGMAGGKDSESNTDRATNNNSELLITDDDNNNISTEVIASTESTADEPSESDTNNNNTSTEAITTIELIAGEQGEYGQFITMSEGTDLEENFYDYYVPAGTYMVTNKGDYMNQINVYEGFAKNKDTGYDEYTNSGDFKLLNSGETATIEVPDGWFIEIHEPAHFSLTLVETELMELSATETSESDTTTETKEAKSGSSSEKAIADTTTNSETNAVIPDKTSETPVQNEPLEETSQVLVWIDDTAKRYHKKNGCGMDNAYQVTLEEAIANGKTPCGRCY